MPNRRQNQWGRFGGSFAVVAGAGVLLDMSADLESDLGIASLNNWTCVRIIAEMSMRALVPASTGVLAPLSCGITSATVDAVGIGVTALSDPGTDNADWYWHWTGVLGLDGSEVAAGVFGCTTRYFNWDMRSARKLREANRTMVFIFKNNSGATITLNFRGRCLLKMP